MNQRLHYDHGAIWLYEGDVPVTYLGAVCPRDWETRPWCYMVLLPDGSELAALGYFSAIEALLAWHRERGMVLA